MANDSIHRDSLRRCDAYSNPYDVRFANHQGVRQARIEAYQRDKLHSYETRMEKEAWRNYFMHAIQSEKGGGAVFAAKAGKYAILALTVPPFFLFYTMPKWMLEQGFPYLYEMALIANRPVKALLDQLRQMASKIARVGERIEGLARSASSFAKEALTKMASPFVEAVNFLREQIEAVREQLQKAMQYISDLRGRIAHKAEDLSDAIRKGLSEALEKSRAYLTQRILAPFEKFGEALQKIPNPFPEGLSRIREQITRLLAPIASAADAVRGFADKARKLVEPVAEKWNAYAESAAEKLNRLRDHSSHLFKRGVERVEDFREKAAESVAKLFTPVVNAAAVLPVQVLHLVQAPFLAILQPMQNGATKLGNGWKELAKAWSDRVRKISDQAKNAGQFLKRVVEKGMELAQKGINQFLSTVVPLLVKAPRFTWELLKKLLAYLLLLVKKAAWAIQILFIWIRVILWYGARFLRENVSR